MSSHHPPPGGRCPECSNELAYFEQPDDSWSPFCLVCGFGVPDEDEPEPAPALTPKPCPFCGKRPEVGPPDDSRGSCWGYVACRNGHCHAKPEVGDGARVNDDRGRLKYIEAAVRRWNKRAGDSS